MASSNTDCRRMTAMCVLVAACLLTAACGTRVADKLAALRSPSPTSAPVATTTTTDVAAAKAKIAANWEMFFSAKTPLASRQTVLENGSQYQQALLARSKDPLMAEASAKVNSVELTGPDQASVSYDVSLNGQTALAGATGVAVLQDGVWKVSAQSFCALITLGTTQSIPGCS